MSQMVDNGKLQEGTGLVLVPMKYKAIVIQVFKNEVVDCEVIEVNKLGFFAELGPVRIFVSKSNLPKDARYTEDEVDSAGGAAYLCETPSGPMAIKKGSPVRVRLIATKEDKGRMMAIGSIDEEYLGPRVLG